MKEYNSQLMEVEVTYRPRIEMKKCKIRSSKDAEQVFRNLFPIDITHREASTALLLNRANNVIGHFVISIGGISGTVVDGKVLFQTALKCNASAIILCHNHPSDQLKPSDADIRLTKNLVQFGGYIELSILDHLILTEESYFSFADEGLI